MKSYFKFFIFLFFFQFNHSSYLLADSLQETYVVEVGKINIGKLSWKINVLENYYKISIKLKDGNGFFSGLYSFEGDYDADGFIINDNLIPLNYKQYWLTKKKKRGVEINFNGGTLIELNLSPVEKEHRRIEYVGIDNHFDPLSSFLNILMGKIQSKTIDGRRIYSMVVVENKKEKNIEKKKVLIKDYTNIWADHTRNDLEYIEISQKQSENIISLPLTVKIKFKGFLFKLSKI